MNSKQLHRAARLGRFHYRIIKKDSGGFVFVPTIRFTDPAPLIGLGYVWGDEYKISLPAKVETFNDALRVCVAPIVFLAKLSIFKTHHAAKTPAYVRL